MRSLPETPDLLFGQHPDELGGGTHPQFSRLNPLARCKEAACSENAIRLDDATVHDSRSHPDESAVFQLATMDQAGMPDGDIITDDDIELAWVNVNDRPVLDVASRTYLYGIVIAAQHTVEPDT
ncbi:hypothetical protein [Mesorhizobium sp. M2A.F.Ca.ET.039.01.1.1]|uniref:hypothetical protein n=1 Tax=Mesorhizobium sp. M2A.F.Ca.ET.039.01.1.1 TaxID=2496746 RepID=UPI0016728CBD|nr:hypothetical protein [Mesorhizobium sp. M2A.F.Ca.ET.039.01.1.1]